MWAGRAREGLVEKMSEAKLAGQGANGLRWPSIPRTEPGPILLRFHQDIAGDASFEIREQKCRDSRLT